eukprot:XP_011665095.1 PREDICTED: uncharacterized protein LOC100890583 [Strongylocentrotus purpuratus]
MHLSNHPLTETEHKVPSLGLNFAVSPKMIPFSEVIQQVEPKLIFLSRTAADQIRFQVTRALSTEEITYREGSSSQSIPLKRQAPHTQSIPQDGPEIPEKQSRPPYTLQTSWSNFDVESLFTNVPVTESCRIVKERLEADDTLPDRTPLTPDEIHDLMYFCLNSSSFKWRDNYYQQLQGAAMGSPLSPVIANIFMEHFETMALQTLSQRPSLWLRYVDDTFIIWPHSRRDLDHFLDHINQHHPSIKFTMETEQNNSIPFLDVLVTKSPSGKPAHQVYYPSTIHPYYKSVPNALIRRAHQLIDVDHLDQEIQHVTTVQP